VIDTMRVTAAAGMSVGLPVSVIGIAAAVGLGLQMIDAIATRARAQDLRNAGPAGVVLAARPPGAAASL
jgi:hypothetical protein